MAHITLEDTKELWNQAPHNWHGLHQAAEQRQGKAEGISNTVIEQLTKLSQRMETSGQNFPDSPDKLYNVLNEHLGGGPDR